MDEKQKENKPKKKEEGLIYIILSIVLFVSRYVIQVGSGKQTNLSHAAEFCKSSFGLVAAEFFGDLAKKCNWIIPLNNIMIITSVALVLYGIYLIYKK